MDFLAANHVRIVGLCGQNKVHHAVIYVIAQLSCLGYHHISTSCFASTANETAVFALFLPVQPRSRY